jgi:hypothetical protein
MIGRMCPLESSMTRRIVHTTSSHKTKKKPSQRPIASVLSPVKIWIMLGASCAYLECITSRYLDLISIKCLLYVSHVSPRAQTVTEPLVSTRYASIHSLPTLTNATHTTKSRALWPTKKRSESKKANHRQLEDY